MINRDNCYNSATMETFWSGLKQALISCCQLELS
jgi:hypothetical protein